MIVFLTLCYIALLFLLIKLRVVPSAPGWKLSPIAVFLLLNVVLFIPLQWGAPAGPVNVYQSVVEVVPNVGGQVIEAPVRALQPVNEGDLLFRIDPEPYEDVVSQLEAQLEAAKRTVAGLQAAAEGAEAAVVAVEQGVEAAKAEQSAAAATIVAAEAGVAEAQANQEKAIAVVEDAEAQIASARQELDRIEGLVERDAATTSQRDRARIQYTQVEKSLDAARADRKVAAQRIVAAQAGLESAKAQGRVADVKLKQLVEGDLPKAKAAARQARAEADSMIGDEHTSVAAAREQWEKAKYDLEQTEVRAPADGYVVNASLRPGQRVVPFPMRSWMSFVNRDETRLVVGIRQNFLRHIEPGQDAEVSLKLYPGRIFNAKVDGIVYVTPQGQLAPSGAIPLAPSAGQTAQPFGVLLTLDPDSEIEVSRLPGGAVGQAAVYTDRVTAAHVIRRVMLRMDAWLNYVKFW